MASPSSLTSRNYKFNVFSSFHGPDVRKTFLSHLREQFKRNGITMFDDHDIERSATIAPSLIEAIRESRISIVILSKNYASSSWCLDELVEILECKKAMGQIVMTIFYGVKPSDVREQSGDFGIAFNETCARKTLRVERQKWSKALFDVGNIAGEDFLRWDNEAKMIEKIARDVSDKLNATPSRDFDGMVGIETHLRKLQSLLDLDYGGVKMVGIHGHVGVGKTTIARAIHSRLSNMFQLTCFSENLSGSYPIGLSEDCLKIYLQEQFLSNILNQDGIRICHLGVIKERLCKQRVLTILDDVNNRKELEALAGDISWFGPGSRIIVTTENKQLLRQHGINNLYHVGFPSDEQALRILCKYAFRQSYPRYGFKELAKRVTELCGNLPLGLRVVGSSLCEKKEDGWEEVIRRLETILDREIENVLRVGYESLDEDEQMLFLHIAVFFNYKDGDFVKAMFADNNMDIKHGLEILANKSLIHISTDGDIVMHKFLQQIGTKVVQREEFWKSRILREASEICDVLERAKGTRAVSGISFDVSGINELLVSKRAFKRMPNLRFLKVYKGIYDGNDRMLIPEEMEFPRCLRLLHWPAYPNKCLPPKFHPEYLVELNLKHSQLEYLWQGTQPLTNLKELDLSWSSRLKELPDLSNASKLEILYLNYCEGLVKLPSSCSHLPKLNELWMVGCVNVEVITAHLNLASLEFVYMRNFSVISTHTAELYVSQTAVKDAPASIRLFSHLRSLDLSFKGLTTLNPSNFHIETIRDCIKAQHGLERLTLSSCQRFQSLPDIPCSLILSPPLNLASNAMFLYFTNCFKLGQQARRAITQHTRRAITQQTRREIAEGMSKISFDISDIDEVSKDVRGYKRMSNLPLQFLIVYKRKYDGTYRMHKLELPHGLRLHWEAYLSKCPPITLHPEYIVELNMQDSGLKKLWKGTQPLNNLKKINLKWSCHLKKLPDLSKATNLEKLNLMGCQSLVEIPYSFSNLHKLHKLNMRGCINLQVIPAHMNLASLDYVDMARCSRLINFPVISTQIRLLILSGTAVVYAPASISLCSRLDSLILWECGKLRRLTHLPTSVTYLDLSYSDIERIPDCIKALYQLRYLALWGCRRLTSLPELFGSVRSLYAVDCDSLKTVFCPLNHIPDARLYFTNCFKLGQQARREIIQRSFFCKMAMLPGGEVPAEFDHRARGNSLTIRLDSKNVLTAFSSTVKLCVVVSPNRQNRGAYRRAPHQLLYRRILNGVSDPIENENLVYLTECRTDHLFVFDSGMLRVDCSEIKFEFSSKFQEFVVIECGAQIVAEKSIG